MKKSMKHVLIKYLFRELWMYFVIAFLFFFLIFFVNHLLLHAEEILEKRVPLKQVALFVFYSLPLVIAQSAPFATLVGFLMCIGRMVSDNEILILRSTGHTFSFLLIPVGVLGLIISILSFGVNDYLLPLGTNAYNKLYFSILVSNPAVELEPYSIKRLEESTIIIGDVQGQAVSDLILFDTDSSEQQRIVIASDVDIVSPQDPAVVMQLNMNKASAVFLDNSKKDTFDFLTSDKALMNIYASTFLPSYSVFNPREKTSYDLGVEIEKMENEDTVNEQLLNNYKLEYHKKFSIPFGSVFFALLALPLAALFGKHNGQTIGLIFGVLISVLYWAFMILGQQFGVRNGFDGFWTMWLPNILVAAFAIFFYVRLIKK